MKRTDQLLKDSTANVEEQLENKVSDMYDSYKPLRNMMRQCNLEASLVDIWHFSQHIMNNGPAPTLSGMRHYSLKRYLFPWDLPIIVREVILHADHRGYKRLNSLNAMRTVINTIRDIENESSKERLDADNVMGELHRISHRQFPWQQKSDLNGLLRYLKIFGSPEVAPILEKKTGFSIRDYFLLGIFLTGHLRRHVAVNAQRNFTAAGIPRDRSFAFFMHLSSTAKQLRDEIAFQQKYDETWEYTWNPLEAKPLISLDPSRPHYLYCPIPDLLLRRFSHGIYYELLSMPGFDIAFGTSFQTYIGELLRAVFNQSSFTVFEEKTYKVRKEQHHGADWILSDADANLFIECKTKRMRLAAKSSVGGSELIEELGIIADAVVQLYKNIQEAEAGKSGWTPNSLSSFPLVVTLEDWFLFSPLPQNLLKEAVISRMHKVGLDLALMESMPYAVASAREFERFSGIINEAGIQKFFMGKRAAEYPQWMWEEYARAKFPSAKRVNLHTLFRNDWLRIFPSDILPET